MKKTILIVVTLVFLSCHNKIAPTCSFYYWKTTFLLSNLEKNTLKNNNVNQLYIRYFDVSLDEKTKQPIPKAIIKFEESTKNFKVIPVIYITNSVFVNPKFKIDDLIQKINALITEINTKNKIKNDEIQIDCDWSLTTKENYFKFIDKIKKTSGKNISATIRLHQIKYYQQTGIPNVDKAVLMYYNMGKIALDDRNSIYDQQIAQKYLNSIENYPLKLNVALPIFSWGIHFRNQRIIGLKSKIDIQDIQKDTNFVKQNNLYFKALYSNYKSGTFYQTNDVLKIEYVSKTDLLQIATDLKKHLKNQPKEVIYYDLDELNYKNYEKEIFTEINHQF